MSVVKTEEKQLKTEGRLTRVNSVIPNYIQENILNLARSVEKYMEKQGFLIEFSQNNIRFC
jgi:hypothetical protein